MTTAAKALVRRDPTWLGVWAIIIAGATAVAWLVATMFLPDGPAFLSSTVLAAAAVCVLLTVWTSPRPLAWRTAALPALMGALAAVAPVGLVLFFRLSVETCLVMNLFGFPWVEPWRAIVQWGSAVVWISSTALLIVGFIVPRLRAPAIVMLGWSIASVVPTFLLYFVTFYGTPAPGCSPV